uniref:Inheritance of peroxisomes protein 1 n=1 Tax=Plectus sambesii TaxID=2011161 RepID=A0A914XFV3_9BILA
MASSHEGRSLDDLYHEAYALVEQGICYDEIGDREGALRMYEHGLELIDAAGKKPDATSNPSYKKMMQAKDHIDERLKDLRGDSAAAAGSNKVKAGSSSPQPAPYEAINGAIEAFGSKEVDEIFLIPHGVQLFMIEGEETTVPTYPEELKIYKFHGDAAHAPAGAEAFIQVGSWVYPLMRGRSPVLHSDFGAYVFPNPTDEKPNLYVGVLLPQDLDKDTVNGFRNILKELTELREQTVTRELSREEQTALGEKIASFIIKGGEYIAWGLKEGADKTGQFVAQHSTRYRSACPKTEQPMVVDQRVQTSIHYLRRGTKVAVKVTGYLLDRIGEIGVHVGRRLARGMESRVGQANSTAGSLVSGTFDVIGGGIVGVSTVWVGMEEAAKSLGKNIANETILVVGHKYGDQAAATTHNAMYAAGHGTMTAFNVANFSIRGIAKRTASKAGVTMLKDLSGTVKKGRPAEAIEETPVKKP